MAHDTSAYDVIIIGTGAGGGTLAHRLAPSGLKVLLLERGGFLPRERENWDPRAVFGDGRYRPGERWLDREGTEFEPFVHYWVGGNTKMYGAALLRLRVDDFDEVRHYGGISPAWPLKYDVFEPYYVDAERLYSVHGARGADPFDPPASAPYPHPPLPHERRIQRLFDDLGAQGLRPFPLPIAVRLPEGPASAPTHLSYFDGYPDPTESKADAHVSAIAPALAFRNVTLQTGVYVERLETDPGGRRVTEVVARRGDEEVRFRGDVVVASCGAVNSAALLLRSASDRHPDGLANGSGMVGRNYMAHHNGAVIAVSDEPNEAQFQKTFGITDFYRGADDSELPLGSIQLMGKTDPAGLAGLVKEQLPDHDPAWVAEHSIDFWLTTEDTPDPDNRVTLTRDGRIQLSYRPTNPEAYQRLKVKLRDALEHCHCGATFANDGAYLGYDLGVSGVTHQNGTCRFGEDPATSVLDLDCKAHALDNLYVVDGSFFPSSGAVNPSLTIMANAMRVGDHLVERLKGGIR
ncbi:MAG: GMC oxidoreductase [Sandaracinaceae bacterium]